MNFSSINSTEKLIQYLEHKERINHYDRLFHYTNIESVKKIVQTQGLVLSTVDNMNDQREKRSFGEDVWKQIRIASLMEADVESIAMWSMYSFPWEYGARISFDAKKLRKCICSNPEIYEGVINGGNIDWNYQKRLSPDDYNLSLGAVAYSDKLFPETKDAEISWSNKHNKLLKNKITAADMAGYIKHTAWDYEKEIRILFKAKGKPVSEKLLVKLSDEVIDSMHVMLGPLVSGEAKKELEGVTGINTEKSMYTDYLNIKTCSRCEHGKYTER